MVRRALMTPWQPGRLPGLLLAVLAMVSQLALGAVVLPSEPAAQERSVAALEALSVLCDATTPAPDEAPRQHRHSPDHALCPLVVALALPAVVLAAGPLLPPPASRMADGAAIPEAARAPPAQPRSTPPARGPPILS